MTTHQSSERGMMERRKGHDVGMDNLGKKMEKMENQSSGRVDSAK